jgi:hypothetical protein
MTPSQRGPRGRAFADSDRQQGHQPTAPRFDRGDGVTDRQRGRLQRLIEPMRQANDLRACRCT